MKKKVLMVSLSMIMVLGLAGIVNATTIGNNATDMQTKALNAQNYMANDNVASMQGEQVETNQPDQIVPSKTDGYNQMGSSNMSLNGQMENMPIDAQMENMPIDAQMENMPIDAQMENMPIDAQMENMPIDAQMENMPIDAQMENMPINTQMQNMPMNTQMSNPEHIQGMAGMNNTSVIQQPKSSSENRMGSMGRMGR